MLLTMLMFNKISISYLLCLICITQLYAKPMPNAEDLRKHLEESARIVNTVNEDLNLDESQHTDVSYGIQSQGDEGQLDGLPKLTLIPQPSKTAESVNLEHEGIPSKILSTYDNSQKKITDLTHPVPIIDTISENEKYGNNGDMFDGISRSIINGYEKFSNLLNTLIQKPKELARSLSKGITSQLDIIGGKIVGL